MAEQKASTQQRRLMREYENLQKSREDWVHEVKLKNDQITDWTVIIEGPEKTPFEKYLFEVTLDCKNSYPFKQPEVIFVTKPYHPNVDQATGKICEGILGKDWSPQIMLMECLRTVRLMLAEPDLTSPLQPDIAKQYKENNKAFTKAATEHCAKHCKKVKK